MSRGLILFGIMVTALPGFSGECRQPSFMVRDDGSVVTDVPTWKPRMLEITRKYEHKVFGMMPPKPCDLKVECCSETTNAFCGKATVKHLRFTWGRAYDKGAFCATAVLPNRKGAAAAFLYVRENPVADADLPISDDDLPVEDIVRRGYATVAFDGSQLTAADAKDSISQRAWALRLLYDWAKEEPRIDEMTIGPVGCGRTDGVAALWAGSYDWRFYLCVAAQCGLDESYVELAANNTPGLLYTCSCTEESEAEIAGDRALAEDVTPAWNIYGGLRGFRGNTDWHLREGGRGLTREDWMRIMDFTDRHGWSIGDEQRPERNVPELYALTKGDWEKRRRPEIVRYFAENVYGVAPGKPADLHFERTGKDFDIMLKGGISAVRHQLRAVWTGPRGKGEFPFLAFVPKSARKVPSVLFLNLRKNTMDPDRKVLDERWDVEQIVKRGYAAISVFYGDISPDNPHDFSVKPFNSFETVAERTNTSWCAVSAWAWGLSRVLDWIVTVPELDANRVIVAGHSRGGKAALWAGVTDTRFWMTVPMGSGRTGMMLNHIRTPVPTETIALINSGHPHWFTPRYHSLNGRDLETDFDHHWLAACIAPRHLYLAESTGDMPRYGDWYSLVLASSAWDLYGVEALKFGPMPRPEKPVCTIGMGFHVRYGPHSVYTSDWTRILDYADLCMLQGR